MNRREIIGVAVAGATATELYGRAVAGAQDASPTAETLLPPVVSAYEEISADYQSLRESVLATGRNITDQLFSDSAADLFDRLSSEMQVLFPREQLAGLRRSLETNRVHFEITEFGVAFDGHLDGDTIEGTFTQGGILPFTMTSAPPPARERPLDRVWKGEIDLGSSVLTFEVTLETVGNELGGTFSVPVQGIIGAPLSNASFVTEQAMGERVAEVAGIMSRASHYYLARYAWGENQIAVMIGIAPDEQINLISVTPEWPLPPDPKIDNQSPVAYALPFEGVWLVIWGGDTRMQNYHVDAAAQRHAYDIVIWKDGATYSGDGNSNEQYWAFGQPLYAPAAGTVVTALDGIPDNTPGVTNTQDHIAGNHVVLQTGEAEFVYLCHMQTGSVRVKPSDQLSGGDLIGLTGNSGNSSEPHLHIHAQTEPDILSPTAIGLPLRFSNYLANGKPVELGIPVQAQLVQRT